MPSFFEKLKKMFGFYPRPYYYKMEPSTEQPVKVEYTPAPEPQVQEPEETAVDTKDDGFDLSAMTKAELLAFAKERGIAVTPKMKKQDIIDAINAAL
jgi:hypothetical protein